MREEHPQALREKVQRATLEQVKDQLEADFRLLRASLQDRQLHFDRKARVLNFFCSIDLRSNFGLNIAKIGGHVGKRL